MGSHMRSRGALSVVAAIWLSLVLAAEALGATWSPPIPIGTGDESQGGGLATLGTSTAVALVHEDGDLNVRRSTNSGSTWEAKVTLDSGVQGAALAAYGTGVDVAWIDGGALRYVRSTNSGASYSTESTLAQGAISVAVARGPNDRVVVAWLAPSGSATALKVRVSTNGGASFGAAKTVASGWFGPCAVAVGNGVIYVAYRDGAGLRVRRSTNSGETFASAKTVATDAYGDPAHPLSMTAVGSRAYLAYSAVFAGGPRGLWARYARTTDKGLTWGAPRNLSPSPTTAGYRDSYDAKVSLQGGILRAAFTRCLTSDCGQTAVFYRQSSDGSSWTTAYRVSPSSGWAGTDGVGYAGKAIVAYTTSGPSEEEAFVRTRTP